MAAPGAAAPGDPGRSATRPDLLLILARMFLAMPFVVFGTLKFFNSASMRALIESGGLPGEIIWLVIPFQIVGGVAVAIGWQTRIAASLLAGFCLLAASLYHHDLANLGELASFTKDFATAGGFILLAVHGPGRYSIDAKRRVNEIG